MVVLRYFFLEQGGKHWRKTSRNLDETVFDLVDTAVNRYVISAIDTRIS